MSNPNLNDQFERLHRRLDRLERRAERSYTLLWLLFPITLTTLALSIPLIGWIAIFIALLGGVGWLVWRYVKPMGEKAEKPREPVDSE